MPFTFFSLYCALFSSVVDLWNSLFKMKSSSSKEIEPTLSFQRPPFRQKRIFFYISTSSLKSNRKKCGLMFKFSQSLCPQLDTFQYLKVSRHILLISFLNVSTDARWLFFPPGELGFPISNYVPLKQKHLSMGIIGNNKSERKKKTSHKLYSEPNRVEKKPL